MNEPRSLKVFYICTVHIFIHLFGVYMFNFYPATDVPSLMRPTGMNSSVMLDDIVVRRRCEIHEIGKAVSKQWKFRGITVDFTTCDEKK